jgi:hypothetical protein
MLHIPQRICGKYYRGRNLRLQHYLMDWLNIKLEWDGNDKTCEFKNMGMSDSAFKSASGYNILLNEEVISTKSMMQDSVC